MAIAIDVDSHFLPSDAFDDEDSRRHFKSRWPRFMMDALGRDSVAFPERLDDNVYFCGYASPDSYGAASYLIVRPEGNVLIRAGVCEPSSGVPDYNTRVTIEKIA